MTASFIAADAETIAPIAQERDLMEELPYPDEDDDAEGAVDVDGRLTRHYAAAALDGKGMVMTIG